jgi:hypothetical protein
MSFVQAKWFTPTNGREITLGVVHRMEAPDKPTTAEAVALFFQNLPATRKASAHSCVDSDSDVQCVLDKDIAYGAPGVNHNGYHIEFPGYSKDDDWSAPGMDAALRRGANIFAEKAALYRFPLVWRNAADLAAGHLSGLTSHWEVTKAHIGGNDHTDPGVYFPVGRFMELVQAAPHSSMAPPPAIGGYDSGGFDMPINPDSCVSAISARQCGIDSDGWYVLTANGGVRAEGFAGREAPFFGSYFSLDPRFRNIDRFFTAISARADGDGYIIHSGTDHSFYTFGPGLSPTGL